MVQYADAELTVAALQLLHLLSELLLPGKGKPLPDLAAEDIVPGRAVLPVAEPLLDSGVKHLLPDDAPLGKERIAPDLPDGGGPEREVKLGIKIVSERAFREEHVRYRHAGVSHLVNLASEEALLLSADAALHAEVLKLGKL